MNKIISIFAFFMVFLFSFGTAKSDEDYHAKFISKEGITFTSYHENWDEDKLKSLYFLLKQNKHGKEFNELKRVDVKPGTESFKDVTAAANYRPFYKAITLFNAENTYFPSEYAHSLSHEYGHHFFFSYLKNQRDESSGWAEVRGVSNFPVQWRKTSDEYSHQWLPQEILAEDYVLLYGALRGVNTEKIKKLNQGQIFWNNLLDVTYHENPYIPYAGSKKEYIELLERISGVKIDDSRKFTTPILKEVKMEGHGFQAYYPVFTFSADDNQDLLYQFELIGNSLGYDFNRANHFVLQAEGNKMTLDTHPNIFNERNEIEDILLHIRTVNEKTGTAVMSPPFCFRMDGKSIVSLSCDKISASVHKMSKSNRLDNYLEKESF